MIEIIAIIFVVLGIISKVMQGAQKGKRASTGFPPPIRPESRKIEIDGSKSLSQPQRQVRKGSIKPSPKQTEERELIRSEYKPMTFPVASQPIVDTGKEYEISVDKEAVLNGVIFSVILSPPKCKGMKSLI